MTTKTSQIEKAANHFVELYSDEIKGGEEITGNAIHEWWDMTVDQYSFLDREDLGVVESAIRKLI